jgi:truncated hemoglobin YjbI
MTSPTPTLYEWLGGIDALNGLTVRFYERVALDVLLGPVFSGSSGMLISSAVASSRSTQRRRLCRNGAGAGQRPVHRSLKAVPRFDAS